MNEKIYSFGNVFEINDVKMKFVRGGHGKSFVEGDGLIWSYGKEEFEATNSKLIGITPTCLAEMARDDNVSKKREYRYVFELQYLPNDRFKIELWSLYKKPEEWKHEYKSKEKESLEEFCLRVARDRNYL